VVFIEEKYIIEISSQLRNYKKKDSTLFNFSCPICGDSSQKKSKARGYLYEKEGAFLYHCHNCDITLNFSNFLKHFDDSLYKQYVFEKFKNNKSEEEMEKEIFFQNVKPPKFISYEPLKRLKKVSSLKISDPVKLFVEKRQIPTNYHYKIFSCPSFKSFVNEIKPRKFLKSDLKMDETRLLIPFINSNGEVHAFQGRTIKESSLKYITIVIDENTPKLYGLDTVNFNHRVYVFEGPIDSMFIPNSIATAGGDLTSALKNYDTKNITIVYDNEPRSIETKNKIDKAINLGYDVCLWPENVKQKDINDMILSKMTPEDIIHIIETNTYRDLKAKLKLIKWSKV